MSLTAPLAMPQIQPGPAASDEDVQAYIEACRPSYDLAKARLAGKDEQYEPRREMLMMNLNKAIKSFSDDDPASKAVLIIGRLQAIVEELDAPRMIILKFEGLQRRLEGGS